MKSPLTASPAQARQTREQFANSEEYLSYELGKAVKELPPLYIRLLAASISLIFLSAIAWAYFSEVEEVAKAPGKIIPSERLRPVRALSNGIIQQVTVEAGEDVKSGEILLVRDGSRSQAEVNKLTESAQLIEEDIRRLEAERSGETSTGAEGNLQNQLLTSRLQEFELQRSAAIAEAERQQAALRQAEVEGVRFKENLSNATTNLSNAQINLDNAGSNLLNAEKLVPKAEESLSLAKERESSVAKLLDSGAVPRLDYLDAQERVARAEAELIKARDEVTKSRDNITNAQNKVTEAQDRVTTIEQEIVAQGEKIEQAQKAYQRAQAEANRLQSTRQSEVLTELNKRKEEQTTVKGNLQQAKEEEKLQTVKAPFAGTVYDIKATQGPVQAGEDLLSILPEGEELLLEVKVLNRDIGFIRAGQKTKVKLTTFPFQEFGTIEGEVLKISPNSTVDEDLGLVFSTTIKLKQQFLKVGDKQVDLVPGMAATGEIVTRKKSVLTFLLEPVTRRFGEAFSVR